MSKDYTDAQIIADELNAQLSPLFETATDSLTFEELLRKAGQSIVEVMSNHPLASVDEDKDGRFDPEILAGLALGTDVRGLSREKTLHVIQLNQNDVITREQRSDEGSRDWDDLTTDKFSPIDESAVEYGLLNRIEQAVELTAEAESYDELSAFDIGQAISRISRDDAYDYMLGVNDALEQLSEKAEANSATRPAPMRAKPKGEESKP